MIVYGICENGRLMEASVHTKGEFFMPLIFTKKREAKKFYK